MAMVFPMFVYSCQSWIIKKVKCQRIDAFEPWCWRRLLRVPWTARRSKQSILRESNCEYSLEGLMLKLHILVTWYEQPTHYKSPWCWERLRAEGEEGIRGWDGYMPSLMQWTLSLSKLRKIVKDREAWHTYFSPWDLKESDTTGWLNSSNKWEGNPKKGGMHVYIERMHFAVQ